MKRWEIHMVEGSCDAQIPDNSIRLLEAFAGQGWELVAVLPARNDLFRREFYFKREIAS